MGDVVLDMSLSLDGFIAGPNDEIEPLHDWLWSEDAPAGREMLDEGLAANGAVVMGRRTFDMVDGPGGWTTPDGTPFALDVFVLRTAGGETVTKGQTTFHFANNGIEDAVARARDAAGDKYVSVMGANAAQQVLQAGLLDVVVLHWVPVLLGEGIRLFDGLGSEHIGLDLVEVRQDPTVTHHRYRVRH